MRSLSHSLPFVLWVTFVSTLTAETLIDDKFASDKLVNRDLAANRGQWKIADGMATCVQDDALYAKNKDHGPVIWYNVTFTDGTVKFAFKPQATKTFVFTLNGDDGHAFRFVVAPTGLAVRAWGEHKTGEEAKPAVLLNPKPGTPALKDGVWLPAELKFEGKRCTLKLADFEQTFEHEGIGKKKTKLGLGFAFGTLAVRDVSVTTP